MKVSCSNWLDKQTSCADTTTRAAIEIIQALAGKGSFYHHPLDDCLQRRRGFARIPTRFCIRSAYLTARILVWKPLKSNDF